MAQDPLPDLLPRLDRVAFEDGDVVVEGAVRNVGPGTYMGGDPVRVRSADGVSRYLTMPEIPSSGEYRFQLTVPGAGPLVELTVEADPLGKVRESDRTNNIATGRAGRLADLAVPSLSVERQPAVGSEAQLLADIRDLHSAFNRATPPTPVDIQVRADLRGVSGKSPLTVIDRRVVIPGFTGQHYLPVDVPLSGDLADAWGDPTADLFVEVCVDPDQDVRETEEVCGDAPGCNNCASHRFEDVVLRADPAPAAPPSGLAVAPLPPADPQPEPEEPVAEEPVAEEPVAEEPVAEEPVAEEPVAEEPVAEEPVAEEPVVEEPVAEEPVVEEPVVEEPVVEEPIADLTPEPPPVVEPPQPVTDALPPVVGPVTEAPPPVVMPAPPSLVSGASPDLVVEGLSISPGIIGSPNQLTVSLRLLRGTLAPSTPDLKVDIRHTGWRFDDHLKGTVPASRLAADGTAQVVISGMPRPTPGRCGPTSGEYTLERFDVRVTPTTQEDLDGLDANNTRSFTLRLACHAPGEAIGLGPYPDAAVSAVEPYVVRKGGKDYLRFMVSLHNLGTPLRTESVQLRAELGDRSWLPESWRAGATGTYVLDSSVVGEPLNGLPPRRVHICGLGGDQLALKDLPDFVRTTKPGRPIGTDNSVELSVELKPSQSIRQRETDNDRLTVVLPLDRELRDVSMTPCGGRPELFGIEATRLRTVLDEPAVSAGAVGATLQTEVLPDGRTELRGEIFQTRPGPPVTVDYAWLRDGRWAGGGMLQVPANSPTSVVARELAGVGATWELVVDPDRRVPGDDPKDNRARAVVSPGS